MLNDCNNIPKLLISIDCKLAELGNQLYNNISYMLNNNSDTCSISKLIMYKRILLYKYNNPKYLIKWSLCEIGDEVRKLTIGCVEKCFKPTCNEVITISQIKVYTNEFNNIFT